MTQKELLYLEDAISHEGNVMKICEDMINTLDDDNLVSFMKREVRKHISLKEKMIKKLEEKSNG